MDALPARVRGIATLRGLGYSFREIGEALGVSPQAVSLMLSRHRRTMTSLRHAMELRGLSTRAVNALRRHGITGREQGLSKEIMRVLANERNCGRKKLAEIDA